MYVILHIFSLFLFILPISLSLSISLFLSLSLSFSLFLSLSLYLVFGLVRLEDLALGEEEKSGEQQEKEHGCFSLEHQVRLFDSSFGGSLYGSFLCASVKCSAPDKTKGQCPWGSSWHLQPLLFLVSGGSRGQGGGWRRPICEGGIIGAFSECQYLADVWPTKDL